MKKSLSLLLAVCLTMGIAPYHTYANGEIPCSISSESEKQANSAAIKILDNLPEYWYKVVGYPEWEEFSRSTAYKIFDDSCIVYIETDVPGTVTCFVPTYCADALNPLDSDYDTIERKLCTVLQGAVETVPTNEERSSMLLITENLSDHSFYVSLLSSLFIQNMNVRMHSIDAHILANNLFMHHPDWRGNPELLRKTALRFTRTPVVLTRLLDALGVPRVHSHTY